MCGPKVRLPGAGSFHAGIRKILMPCLTVRPPSMSVEGLHGHRNHNHRIPVDQGANPTLHEHLRKALVHALNLQWCHRRINKAIQVQVQIPKRPLSGPASGTQTPRRPGLDAMIRASQSGADPMAIDLGDLRVSPGENLHRSGASRLPRRLGEPQRGCQNAEEQDRETPNHHSHSMVAGGLLEIS